MFSSRFQSVDATINSTRVRFLPNGPVWARPAAAEDTAPAHHVNPVWRQLARRLSSEGTSNRTTRFPWLYKSGYLHGWHLYRAPPTTYTECSTATGSSCGKRTWQQHGKNVLALDATVPHVSTPRARRGRKWEVRKSFHSRHNSLLAMQLHASPGATRPFCHL